MANSDCDPERARIDDLIGRLREGTATDSDREELALYAEEHEDVAEAMTRAESQRTLGGDWLVRAEADKRNEAAGRTPLVIAERTVGSTLAVAGAIGALVSPALGLAAVAGLGLLGFSALRVHLKTAAKDPYKGVEK